MSEITLSPNAIHDTFNTFEGIVSHELDTNHYKREDNEVPIPDYANFRQQIDTIADHNLLPPAPVDRHGRITVSGPYSNYLQGQEGIRGVAVMNIKGQKQPKIAPAILLNGAQHVAILTAEQSSAVITPTQHALLSTEFLKFQASVSQNHSSADNKNVGALASSLMVASGRTGSNPHRDMHSLASNRDSAAFATNFSANNRQDIRVGHNVRRVLSAVTELSKVAFIVGPEHQLPTDGQIFDGIAMSSGQLAVGMTLAAANSRFEDHSRTRLARNLSNLIND